MAKVYDLFTGKEISEDVFYDVNKNAEKYTKELEKKLKKKYTTLLFVKLEPAGHITFRFQSNDEKTIKKDIANLKKDMAKRGVSKSYIWGGNVSKFGNSPYYGYVDSLAIDVLSSYYRIIKRR